MFHNYPRGLSLLPFRYSKSNSVPMSNQGEKSDRRSFRETYRSTSQDAPKESYTSASPSTSKGAFKGGSPGSSRDAYKSGSPKSSKDPYNISSPSTSKDLFSSSSPGTSKDSYSSSSQSSPRDPFKKVPQDNSSMSMKVNVMYRGIVYRVRGIKVLCSVVTAVILLLVAIVGLGVWMLVSAYGEEKAGLSGSNSTSFQLSQDLKERGDGNYPTPSTIDFNAPSVTLEELSIAAVVPSGHTDESHQVGEAIGHFQGVTPGKELKSSSRSPGPDPAFGLFSGIFDLKPQSEEATDLAPTPSGIPSEEQFLPEDSEIEYSETSPVAILPPTGQFDYDGSQIGYVRDSNLKVESFEVESSPVYQDEYPPSVLPENLPRDIDPTLFDLGLPYHYPPSILPGPAPTRRRNNPRFRGGTRRIPQGNRRNHPPARSGNIRPPYERHEVNERPAFGQRLPYAEQPYDRYENPAYDTWQPSFPPYEYDQGESYEQHNPQLQRPQNSEFLPSEERSTVREAQTESYERSDRESSTPSGINYSLLQQFGADRGVTIPEGFSIPPGFKMPGNVGDLQDKENGGNRRITLAPGGYFEDMMHYYNKHEKTTTTTPPPQQTSTDDFSQRKGVSESEDHPDYAGPPVVGYGDHPYRRTTSPSDSSEGVFEYFWDVYDSKDRPPARHDDRGPAPEDDMEYSQPMHPSRRPRPRPRPNVRGGVHNGQGYPLPMRPDAQVPPVLNPDRRLWVGPDRRPRPQMAVRPPPTSTIHPLSTPEDQSFLGPLQDVYEYSQRLASSLLNFPATLYTQINESKAEYMRNEVELLEDYNKVFKNSDVTSTDVLPDMYNDKPNRNERVMIIDTEKIRSLNPFELSLITWTFLDFWEFLIEKVGTLSQEDLQLLEMRLERVRQDKDRRMTKNLVAATMQQVSGGVKNSQDVEQMRSLTERLFNSSSSAEGGGNDKSSSVAVAEARMWDPLGLFNSEQRVKFMEFAMKVVFRFGRVYLTKRYALDCMMLLFCKDLNADTKKEGMDGVAAKVKR